jgi:hypothetical protein
MGLSAPNKSIGVRQSWQDLTASRAKATNYTNSTGRAIKIIVSLGEAFPSSFTITVGGVVTCDSSHSGSGYNGWSGGVIIPEGAVYKVDGAGALKRWVELR